ncbi:MAG: cation diffusion facilitator family transporter [Oscillospiraceae bacterium]|nr:cation diffusion facilitator family transporter [Oscillospiraceae bacterium]
MTKQAKSREQISVFVSVTNIIFNTLLTSFQLFAGIFAGSQAMISDAIHSLSDGLSTILVIIGVKLAAQKPDAKHQYGHERFESVAAILLSAVLVVTGAGIGWAGIQRIIDAGTTPIAEPGILALIAAIVGIAVKESMYWRTRYYAKKLNSSVLMADAWHNRSDSLSSIGSFAAILGARMGFPVLDPLASIIISVFILKVAVDVFRNAVGKMTDRAVDEETATAIRAVVEAQHGVTALDLLQTRVFGDRVYVDIEIAIDRDLPLHAAHDIAQGVHNAVEAGFPAIKHCMVHMNPTAAGEVQ